MYKPELPRPIRYNKTPATVLTGHDLWVGAPAWSEILREALSRSPKPVIVVDAYPGVDFEELKSAAASALPDFTIIDVETSASRSSEEIDALIGDNITDDRVFGVMSHRTLLDFYNEDALATVASDVARRTSGVVLLGWGAALVPVPADLVVLADMARWEIQLRQRAGATSWRRDNSSEDAIRKFKRGYFVEWRMADRHKQTLFPVMDYVMDTNLSTAEPKLITAETFRAGLAATVAAPFRVVPFFDPGIWGGQWMREMFELGDEDNYAWCFDCVPEENSLLFDIDGEYFELPSINLVFTHPRELLGELTHARFGAEFPIRFDFLDTMEGGNLSLQVHPLTGYIQDKFGMVYTQDESYYMLDSEPGAMVYLGLKTNVDKSAMLTALATAADGGESFQAEQFINTFPARKHDHFLIPAGTVHASGSGSMVLEISATPYIFTFKMWDWDRVGRDGIPRPISLEHAEANIQWNRDTEWTNRNLVGQMEQIAEGDGWVEERTGLHALEFIDVRRHWFSKAVSHNTHGTVNVLNLVEGAEATVTSPAHAFEPFTVHYAETFIIPAVVGAYTISPSGPSEGLRIGTVKAHVRATEVDAAF
ncbi:class I mannose-6-phosphate isomerase [Salinibacterium sp.]|uniref:class I mannose-6-phosphate isomerase n=1 Tax=Salinibacterium sp. TaxID=1915057 RepID=UPI00286BA975|nr:class I mannose-6-phosphate isomerase [Salinibacterium sp.]